MRRTYLGLLLTCGSLTSLAAQTAFYSFSGGLTGNFQNPITNHSPFSAPTSTNNSLLTQCIVSRLRFQNAPVTITSLSFSSDLDGILSFQSLVIRMGHLVNDQFASGVFSQNRPAVLATVLDVRQYTWPARSGEWVDIGVATPFVYTPQAGNLFVEIEAIGITGQPIDFYTGGGVGQIINLASYSGATPPTTGGNSNWGPVMRIGEDIATVQWLGRSCAGSGGTNPGLGFQGTGQLGTTTSIVLSNALPSRLSMLVFGFNIAPPLPQNLSAIGMPNCFQYCDVVATAALVTSATGVATYNLAIPSGPAFSGAILYEQYYVADPAANAAGALATNFGRVLTGF